MYEGQVVQIKASDFGDDEYAGTEAMVLKVEGKDALLRNAKGDEFWMAVRRIKLPAYN